MTERKYVAVGGETLHDVAEKTGVDYASIARMNRAFIHTKLRKGTQILLEIFPDEEEEEDAEQKKAEEDANRQAEEEARKAAQKEAEAARKKEAQKQEAQAKIYAAETEYRQESAYAQADHTQKINRLTEQMRSNRNRLEGDLAGRRIADSSIAENERNKLQKQEADERESIELQTSHKLNQLARKLETTKNTQQRKINNL